MYPECLYESVVVVLRCVRTCDHMNVLGTLIMKVLSVQRSSKHSLKSKSQEMHQAHGVLLVQLTQLFPRPQKYDFVS